jgi:hypothetical protein
MTIAMMSLSILAGAAGTARAEDTPASTATPAPLLKVRSLFEAPAQRPIFTPAVLAAAAQNAQAATSTTANNHQFGIGARVGVEDAPSIGFSARYFFYGGPLGVQGELTVSHVDYNPDDITAIRFSPAAIYRWYEYKFNGPVSLTPYAGAGLNFVSTRFDDDVFPPGLNDTNVGVLLFGGVELFFERVPNLGVSGELTFNSNDDVDNAPFGNVSLGGVTFTAAGHWYFW